MRSGLVRSVVLLLCIAAGLTVARPAGAAPGSTTHVIRGTVICTKHAVVGVWVKSSTGQSSFAQWFALPKRRNAAYFTATIKNAAPTTTVQLAVGCGGTEKVWRSKNRTSFVAVKGSRTLNTKCDDSVAATRQSCKWPPSGGSNPWNYNNGYPGQCTWLANEEWKSATGAYPYFPGDAWLWNDLAAKAAYQVSMVPHRRAVVVFEPGVQYAGDIGHVAWVRDVRKRDGRVEVLVWEMNWGGPFITNQRWVEHVDGMSYIVAPI